MEKRKEYRSAVRSRRLIRQAFVELLREKPFEKITVTDIVGRADINRSTFYAHYPDVRGLVEEIMGEAIDHSTKLAAELDFPGFLEDPMPFLGALISFGIENQELYALLGQSDYALRQMEELKRTMMERAAASMEFPEEIRSSPAFQIQIGFFIGGILNLYVLWLQGHLKCSIDDITEQMALLIRNNANIYRGWK